MNHRNCTYLILIFFTVTSSGQVCAQSIVNAMVADSATLRPLPNVNIQLKNSYRGTVSSDAGYFLIQGSDSDTLVFSMVGYNTQSYRIQELKTKFIIYMTQESTLLKTITIDANMQTPWNIKIPPMSPYRNLTQDPRRLETPGFQGVQTFGPGVVISGPFSRFSKEEKEKKKLVRVREANQRAKGYVEVVNDPEVKDRIIKEYSLTEEEYFKHLAVFNEKNKDIIYELDANELTSLLFIFFEENAKKK